MMIISAKDFKEAISQIKPAFVKTSPMDILTHVRFIVNDESYTLIASNGQMQMRHKKMTDNNDDCFDICVKSDKLDLVASAAKDEIKFELKDNKLICKTGKSKFQLAALDGVLFPLSCFDGSFNIDVNLQEVLRNVFICADENASARPYLTGVNLKSDGQKITATGTDGTILATNYIDHACDEFNVILPFQTAKLLSSIDTESFCVADGQIHVLNGNTIITSKLIDSQFPNCESIFFDKSGECSINKSDFVGALNTAERITVIGSVNLEAKDGVLSMSTSDASNSLIAEIDCVGDDFQCAFNVMKIKPAMGLVTGDNVVLHWAYDQKKFGFNDNNLRFITTVIK